MEPIHVAEESKVSFPLKTLVTVLAATAVAVSGYLSVTHRLTDLEAHQTTASSQIDENETWINNFEPPAAVKDTVEKVRELEIRIAILETLVKKLR